MTNKSDFFREINNIRILTVSLCAIGVWWLHFNLVETRFINGTAELEDTGLFAFLIYKSSIFLDLPRSTFLISSGHPTFWATHTSPMLFILSWPSHIIPIDIIDNASLIFGFQGALLVFSLGLSVSALRMDINGFYHGAIAGTAGICLYFSSQNMMGLLDPHIELFYSSLAILFFTFFALGKRVWAVLFFLILLTGREDFGFHIFGLIILFIGYEFFFRRIYWRNFYLLAALGILGFSYCLFVMILKSYMFPDYVLLKEKFIGQLPFAHVTMNFIIERFSRFFIFRLDLILALLATIVFAFYYRTPQYLLGYAASVPWIALNVLGYREGSNILSDYHGFPLVLALAWPIVYELLDSRWLITAAQTPLQSNDEGRMRSLSSKNTPSSRAWVDSARRSLAVVVATILICIVTTILTPGEPWKSVIKQMIPQSNDKRLALNVLADFLEGGLHQDLKLRVGHSVAAVGPDQMDRNQIVLEDNYIEPAARGVIYFSSGEHRAVIKEFINSNRFDRSVRFGESNIYISFYNKDQKNILNALQKVNRRRVQFNFVSRPYFAK